MTVNKEKIAILGGGMSSLMTAFALTEEDSNNEKYDITVYQMGWRLGGKGASSRNLDRHGRIEEHGLHVFYGFYENTFRWLRRCYEELGRGPDQPLATWRDAFTPHNFIALQEQVEGEWLPWHLPFSSNPHEPGDDAPLPTLWESLSHLMEYGAGVFDYWHFGILPEASRSFTDSLRKHAASLLTQCRQIVREPNASLRERATGVLHCVAMRVMQSTLQGFAWPESAPGPLPSVFLRLSQLLVERLAREGEGERTRGLKLLVWLLRNQRDQRHRMERMPKAGSQRLRRMMVCEDLFLTAVIGLVEDGLTGGTLDWLALDQEDTKDWLRRHGAHATTVDSSLVDSLYDAVFSRDFGVAAGTMLHAMIRMFCTYKGAFMWKMNAGMGETIFAPLYEVLRKRGVNFRFFHRVDRLEIGEHQGRKRIERVVIGRQATLRDDRDEYQPLIDVDGLPCWPAHPDYNQLNEGDALRDQEINLENWWTPWRDPVAPLTLEADRDFDRVVLGISIGALPYLCEELVRDNPRFASMLQHVRTTQTQAVQLWIRPTLQEKGWTQPSPILIQYAEPFDTWADMTHLLPVEGSPDGHSVGSVAYLCARLQDKEVPPPRDDHDYPHRQNQRVYHHGLTWLSQHGPYLWPNLASDTLWEALVDPEQRQGQERFLAQYWHAPSNPSDRYVLAPAGSTAYRLRTDESGYHNLLLTGDWTLNSMNVGCIEGATMAGLATARAISGQPIEIVGDWVYKRGKT